MDSYLVEVIDEENESCVIINFAESIHELVDNVVCMENFQYIKKIKRQSDQKDIKLVNNEINLEELRVYRILIDDEVELRNILINNDEGVDNIQ
jgi:hypothetical protein